MPQHKLWHMLGLLVLLWIWALTPTEARGLASPIGNFDCNKVSEIPVGECQALVSFYTTTGGAAWTNRAGWLGTNTPCSWYGVTCMENRVTRLALGGNNLTGSLTPLLSDLTNLQAIALYSNHLSGQLPPQWDVLTNLETLALFNNQLSGTLPPEWGALTHLRYLEMYLNQLSGPLPPQWNTLTDLQILSLSSNRLSGSLPPQWNTLTDLASLSLGNNQLSGTLTPEWSTLIGLEHLSLVGNQLSGTLPHQWSSLTNLTTLYLDDNQLSGTLPHQWSDLSSLTFFDLSNNQLSGSLPSQWSTLTSLRSLHLSNNQLGDVLPPSLTNLSELGFVDFSYNMFSATEPELQVWLEARQPAWDETQTVPPTNLQGSPVLYQNVRLTWTPILYQKDGGNYQVSYTTSPGGPYTLYGVTTSKSDTTYLITGLAPATEYCFVVRAFTPAHNDQQNDLLSEPSPEVCATTSKRAPFSLFLPHLTR